MSENENSKKDNWDKCKIGFDIARSIESQKIEIKKASNLLK
jgi:hypothetical protein